MKESDFIPAELGEAITLYWNASKVQVKYELQSQATLAVLGKNAFVFVVHEWKWICILGSGWNFLCVYGENWLGTLQEKIKSFDQAANSPF